MATLHKLELYLIDFDDNWEVMKSSLESVADKADLSYEIASHEQSEEFEWDDDLKINKLDCTIEDYEEYFKKNDFECIFLSVMGNCNKKLYTGVGEDNKTIDDCPKCDYYNDCLNCDWYYRLALENKACKNKCKRGR